MCLGCKVTNDDAKITGSRLPTSLQVLRCLMYHLDEGACVNRTRWQSAKLVLSKLTVFYKKANLPMISESKACEKIIKLLDDNAKIRAIPLTRRSTPNCIKKVQAMEAQLAKTFPLWPANVEQTVKNTEDLRFLESMKTNRLATFGSRDKVLAAKLQRRHRRKQLQETRRDKMLKELMTTTLTSEVASTDESDVVNSTTNIDGYGNGRSEGDSSDSYIIDTSATTARKHRRTARTGAAGFIPHDILKRPKLVALATRLKMTPAQQAIYTEALIEEAGGDPTKVSAS